MSSNHPQLQATIRLFVSDHARTLRNTLLPAAQIFLTKWNRDREEVELAMRAVEKDLSKIGKLLKTLMRREGKMAASAAEWVLIQAILRDRDLQRCHENRQQEVDEAIQGLGGLREKCEERRVLLSRREQKLDDEKSEKLKTLLRLLYHVSRSSINQFHPFAKLLENDVVRRDVTRDAVEQLLPIVGELCELFGRRAEKWRAWFEPWLLTELRRVAAEEVPQTEPERASNPPLVAVIPAPVAIAHDAAIAAAGHPSAEPSTADAMAKAPREGAQSAMPSAPLVPERERTDPRAKWGEADWKRAELAATLYEELQQLQKIAIRPTTEERLKRDNPSFKIWTVLDGVAEVIRNDFFGRIKAANSGELYEFVGGIIGSAPDPTKKYATAWRTRSDRAS